MYIIEVYSFSNKEVTINNNNIKKTLHDISFNHKSYIVLSN